MLKQKAPEDLANALHLLAEQEPIEFPDPSEWLNTRQRLTFGGDLRGKFVVLDFWTSCCINCIHMLAELSRLQQLFKDFREIVFIGCHSAKYPAEGGVALVRQAIRRHGIRHAILNDPQRNFLSKMQVESWPTVIIVSPDGRELFRVQGEHKEERIAAFLYVLLLGLVEGNPSIPWQEVELNYAKLPVLVEGDKTIGCEQGAKLTESGIARRQNLSHPGKVFYVRASPSDRPFPYAGVTEMLVIADSGNNRLVIVNASINMCVDLVGSGLPGF